jgi:Protein of unknown function (DUF2735)
MNQTFNHGSARIYQFPAGGRAALGGRRLGETRSIDQSTSRVNEAMCCDSWYHEEAIQQEKALSKLPIKPSWDR